MSLGVVRPEGCLSEVPGGLILLHAEGKEESPFQGSSARILSRDDTLHIHEILPSIPSCYRPCQAGLRHITSIHSCKLG